MTENNTLAGRADAAVPGIAAPAGDLISRARDLLAEWEYTPAEGDPMIDVLLGVISETLSLLRALPAAPEAGEVERLHKDAMFWRKEADERGVAHRAAEARLIEAEAERDAQSAIAFEAAANIIDSLIAGGHEANGTALRRASGPAVSKAALERIIADRVQAALAAQGEQVAWRYRCAEKLTAWTDPTFNRRSPYARIGMEEQALYAAPASAGVTVRPLDLRNAVQAGFDAWAAKPHNKKWVRKIDGTPIPNDVVVCIQTAVCAALSQPAQAGEG